MNVRRPMVFILLAVMAGCVSAYYFSWRMSAFLLIAGGSAWIFNRVKLQGECHKRRFAAGLLLLFFIAGFFRMWAMEAGFLELKGWDGQELRLSGTVLQAQVKGDGIKLLIASKEPETRILVQFWTEDSERFARGEGRQLQATGVLRLPKGSSNPGTFDYARYLKGKGTGLLLDCEPANVRLELPKANLVCHLRAALCDFREDRRERFLELLGAEEGGLLIGMLLGDKNSLDEELYESFQKNGIAHILCVSGIHISIVCDCLERMLVRQKKRTRSVAVLSGLLFYAALASFAPSVMRAVFMVSISILGRLFLQRYDRLSALCFSCLLMTLWNPYLLFQAGFQLSYMAVASLILVLPWLEAMTERLVLYTRKENIRPIGAVVAPLIALQVVMAPITAYLFNYFSFSAFFLNGPILLAAGLVIPIGMLLLAMPACFFEGFLAVPLQILSYFTKVLLHFMSEISQGTSLWDWTSFHMVSPTVGMLFLFYGMVGFFCSECRHLQKRIEQHRRVTAVFLVLFILSNGGPWMAELAPLPVCWSKERFDLAFVDVGQGDCLHIRTPSGKNVLIDGGGSRNYPVGKKTLLPYLLKNGVSRIDLAIVTHLHDDHFRGIRELAQEIEIEKLGLHDMNRYRRDEWSTGAKQPPAPLFLAAGDRIFLEKDIWIDVLWPEKQTERAYEENLSATFDENDNSLLLKICYRGTKILVTGDMGHDQEERVLQAMGDRDSSALDADILKVGHHGSPTSTKKEFVEAVAPQAAVIQVGKNNFGHPSAGVIELLRNCDIMVFRNDLQGAVLLQDVRDGNATLTTMVRRK